MAESWEDWEAEAEKEVKEIKKVDKFGEAEEAVDLETKNEVKVQTQPRNKEKEAEKEKQKHIAKKWEEKEKAYEDVFNDKKGPLTAEERRKAELRSKESDVRNIVDSFGGFIDESSKHDLKTEKAFIDFAKQISDILVKGDRKKYIQEFMKELLQQIYPKLTSLEYEEIHSKCTILFNQKSKEEKGPGQKKKAGAKVNASRASNAAKAMDYSDGDDDDYGGGKYNDDDFM